MLIKADDDYYFSTPACKISVEEVFIKSVGTRYLYEVRVLYADKIIPIKTFKNKQNARTFAETLAARLNDVEEL